jgi:hypothetical protein
MKTIKLAAVAAALSWACCVASIVHAAPVPCTDKLAELRGALQRAKLSDLRMTRVRRLEAKGVERCNADDDERSDAFFDDAMRILMK